MSGRIALVGLFLAVAGCSSSGTSGTGVCRTSDAGLGSPSSGSVSWTENGTPACASIAIANRSVAAGADTIQINASTLDNRSVTVTVSSYAGPLGGTYTCQPGDGTTAPKVTFDYVGTHGAGGAAMSECSITIAFSQDSAGTQHTKGRFSATVSSDATDGGAHEISGTFDLTLTSTGG